MKRIKSETGRTFPQVFTGCSESVPGCQTWQLFVDRPSMRKNTVYSCITQPPPPTWSVTPPGSGLRAPGQGSAPAAAAFQPPRKVDAGKKMPSATDRARPPEKYAKNISNCDVLTSGISSKSRTRCNFVRRVPQISLGNIYEKCQGEGGDLYFLHPLGFLFQTPAWRHSRVSQCALVIVWMCAQVRWSTSWRERHWKSCGSMFYFIFAPFSQEEDVPFLSEMFQNVPNLSPQPAGENLRSCCGAVGLVVQLTSGKTTASGHTRTFSMSTMCWKLREKNVPH